MVKACAEAMGYTLDEFSQGWRVRLNGEVHALIPAPGTKPSIALYWPLTNDAQTMALVKRLEITCIWDQTHWMTRCETERAHDPDLNRAIVECVARLSRQGAR